MFYLFQKVKVLRCYQYPNMVGDTGRIIAISGGGKEKSYRVELLNGCIIRSLFIAADLQPID